MVRRANANASASRSRSGAGAGAVGSVSGGLVAIILRGLLVLGILMTLVFAVLTLLGIDDTTKDSNAQVAMVRSNLRASPAHLEAQLQRIQPIKVNITYMTCDNGEVTNAVFGDNYCDCKDGSDELTTNACSLFFPHEPLFECKDPHDKKIFLSRVNDNVCDCPNGKDEYDSQVNCVKAKNKFFG
jgi:hypothetical protein